MDEEIDCWGVDGREGCPFEATYPGGTIDDYEKSGWGFTMRNEDAEAFYACPECKDKPIE